jgi:hypothetical protein
LERPLLSQLEPERFPPAVKLRVRLLRSVGPRAFQENDMPTEPINGREPELSEDDIQREQLGPRGVPGKESPAKMTPQRDKKTPGNVDPGHTA